MRDILVALLGTAVVVSGCVSQQGTASPTSQRSSDAHASVSSTTSADDSIDTLSQVGVEKRTEIPAFLSNTGLSALLSLKELGGTKNFTAETCKQLLAIYKMQRHSAPIRDEELPSCDVPAGSDFKPLLVSIGEVGKRYLLLQVDAGDLCGPSLFTYAYDGASGRTFTIDRSAIPCAQDVPYRDDTLQFFTVNYEGSGRRLQGQYDLRKGQMTLQQQ